MRRSTCVEDRGQLSGVGLLLPCGFCETDLHHQALAADIFHTEPSHCQLFVCLFVCFFLSIHCLVNLKTYCFLHSKILCLKETVLILAQLSTGLIGVPSVPSGCLLHSVKDDEYDCSTHSLHLETDLLLCHSAQNSEVFAHLFYLPCPLAV